PAADRSLPATVLLCATTVMVALGIGGLFRGGWAGAVLSAAVVGHATCWLWRRMSLPNWIAVPLTVASVGLVAAWVVLGPTTFYGLPTPSTFSTAVHDLSDARTAFRQLTAPVPPLPGFLLAGVAGAGLLAILSDWAAFRLHAPLEALVPGLGTIIFVGVMSPSSRHPIGWVAGFAGAGAAFVAAHHLSRAGVAESRSGGGSPSRVPLTAGAVLVALVALGASAVIGPKLPGANAAALLPVRGHGSGPSHRTTISPLVDIKARLINQSDVELFTVKTTQPEYWRLTSLDHFDGRIWSSDEPYTSISGDLPPGPTPSSPVVVQQNFNVANLGSVWLPAAYVPLKVSGINDVSYDPASDSLISDQPTSDGEIYQVVSVVPHFTPDELRRADVFVGSGPGSSGVGDLARYLALPAVPADVRQLAFRITEGATTPYDKALALQNYLRRNYSYSLDVPAGHSDSALDDFLFVTKKGYCEQFAGAYAVMARAVGLPTRVAVGFTPGVRGNDGLWHVEGLHAHAWPEVLLGQYGWVAFDATPGRGEPGATSYTGVAAQQASPTGTQAITAAPSTTQPVTTPGSTPRSRSLQAAAGLVPSQGSGARGGSGGGGPSPAALAVLCLIGAVLLTWVVGVPAARRTRRRRRWAGARTDSARVAVAWAEAAEALALGGLGRRPSETMTEHARRAGAGIGPDAADALAGLAGQAGQAAYGPPVADGEGVLARRRAHTIEAAVAAGAPRWRRVGWELDPRPRSTARRA
ncbi:MAG TPA: DUF3488 and transglutaminase-like domain-containing protein, partial [Acidimicrobiales bacterium]|nr:DUF3488 and transglutaminase-like domain-containing protein [Acidimicrobiales bacterium]